jgi:lipopolysaccharide heptosyltransferase II
MQRILVRSPNWIGDQVLAFPFFHHLRKAYPRSRITAVCVEWVEATQYRGLVDEVVRLPRAYHGTLRERVQLIEQAAAELRSKGPWDLSITLPNSLSSAWLAFRSGSRRRIGYRADGRGLLLNAGVDWEKGASVHRAQAYLNLLPEIARPARPAQEFWGVAPEDELDEPLPGELEKFDHARFWPGVEQVPRPAAEYWVLAPGATADSRRWPVEYFRQLARKVHQTTGLPGVIVGGPKEAPLASELSAERELGLLDRTAQGPVTGLAHLFEGARFTVSNESGLAHVAALCGSFTQIICGAADPKRTRPLGPGKVQVAINPVECWPCERNQCSQPPGLLIQCLRGIRSEAVWEEIERGLRAK